MDQLQAAVEARTQSILEDMRDTGLELNEASLLIVIDISEFMHPAISFDYLLDTLAIHAIRDLINTPRNLH